MNALRSGQAHCFAKAVSSHVAQVGWHKKSWIKQVPEGHGGQGRSEFDDGDGDRPMRRQRMSAKRNRERAGLFLSRSMLTFKLSPIL